MEDYGNYEDLEFSELQKQYVLSTAENYINQVASYPLNEGTLGLYKVVDDLNKDVFAKQVEQPKCKKGCAHCCHIQVQTSPREVDLVYDYIKNKPILDSEKMLRLEEQSRIKDDREYMFSPHRRCVFLQENNDCGIYEVRPFACRNYYVFSDPENCNTFTAQPGTRTLVHFDINSLPVMIALKGDEDHDSFAKLLLKRLRNE